MVAKNNIYFAHKFVIWPGLPTKAFLCSIQCQLGRLDGEQEDLLPRWLTCTAGKEMLVVGWELGWGQGLGARGLSSSPGGLASFSMVTGFQGKRPWRKSQAETVLPFRT